MARNLNENSDDGSYNADGDSQITGEPRRKTAGGLLGTILFDAYNIAIAVTLLAGAYWAFVGELPLGLPGFATVFGALLTLDVLATVR